MAVWEILQWDYTIISNLYTDHAALCHCTDNRYLGKGVLVIKVKERFLFFITLLFWVSYSTSSGLIGSSSNNLLILISITQVISKHVCNLLFANLRVPDTDDPHFQKCFRMKPYRQLRSYDA